MAHDCPQLVADNIRLLQSDNHYFFVHVDRKTSIDEFRRTCAGFSHVVFLTDEERLPVSWGGASMVLVELLLFRNAFRVSPRMDYFHLISGHDYPCKDSAWIDAFFEKHHGESFMKYDTWDEVRKWRKKKYPERYRTYGFHDKVTCTNRWINFFRLPILLLQRYGIRLRKSIPNVYGGWNWISWHRDVVAYILEYIEKHPEVLKRLRYTSCMDEIVFHTILHEHLEALRIHPDNALRYIEWHPKRPAKSLPLVLNKNEYNAIVHSDAIFCRKVDVEESATLISLIRTNVFHLER